MTHSFWVHTNRSTIQQKLFQFFFLPQQAGDFGNNIEKEPQIPHSKLKKNTYIIYLPRIFALPAF